MKRIFCIMLSLMIGILAVTGEFPTYTVQATEVVYDSEASFQKSVAQIAKSNELFLAYKYDSVFESVKEQYEKSKDLGLSNLVYDSVLMNVGDSVELCWLNAKGIDALHNYTYSWESSDSSVATVDYNGKITALSNGTATITLSYNSKPKLIGKKYSESTSVKVKVGKNDWGLLLGTKSFIDTKTITVGVNGSVICDLGLLDDNSYEVSIESSNPYIVPSSSSSIGFARIFGARKGSTDVNISVSNRVTGFFYEQTIRVNVIEQNGTLEWDNPYYKQYGEDYINLFRNVSPYVIARPIESMMYYPLAELFSEKFNKISVSALVELSTNGLKTGIFEIIHGKNSYINKLNEETITYFLEEIKTSDLNSKYFEKVEKELKKINDVCEIIEKTPKYDWAWQSFFGENLELNEAGENCLFEFLDGGMFDVVNEIASDAVEAAEYVTAVVCLFELEDGYLDMLQAMSKPGEALYDDIQRIRETIYKDPVKYFENKFYSDKGIEYVTKTLKAAAGLGKGTSTVQEFISMVADMNGIPSLKDEYKAARLLEYRASITECIRNIENELKSGSHTYSKEEIIEMIEEYECACSLWLAIERPLQDSIKKLYDFEDRLHPYLWLISPSNYISNYDYGTYIGTAMQNYYKMDTIKPFVYSDPLKLGPSKQTVADSFEMKVGDSMQLGFYGAVGYNRETDGKTKKWTSSDTSVITVDNGKINAIAPGQVEITCRVNVLKTDASYVGRTVITVVEDNKINEAIVTRRIMELAKHLGINDGNLNEGTGRYFTVNEHACDKNICSDYECENCYNANVLASQWFREEFGYNVDVKLLPRQYKGEDIVGSYAGYTCYGFANFVGWYIAKTDENSDVYRKQLKDSDGIGYKKFTMDNLKSLDIRIGDIVRITGNGHVHSFVFLKYVDDDTILMLDNNAKECGAYRCGIHTYSFKKKAGNNCDGRFDGCYMAVTRMQNYYPDYGKDKKTPTVANKVTPTVTATPTPLPTSFIAPVNTPKVSYEPTPTFTPVPTITKAVQPESNGTWSEWLTELPSWVDNDLYDIETKTQYKETKWVNEISLEGWIKTGKSCLDQGLYGEWTDKPLVQINTDLYRTDIITKTEKKRIGTRYFYYVFFMPHTGGGYYFTFNPDPQHKNIAWKYTQQFSDGEIYTYTIDTNDLEYNSNCAKITDSIPWTGPEGYGTRKAIGQKVEYYHPGYVYSGYARFNDEKKYEAIYEECTYYQEIRYNILYEYCRWSDSANGNETRQLIRYRKR